VDPDSIYAFRIQARLRDGRTGNLSDVVFAGVFDRTVPRGPDTNDGNGGGQSDRLAADSVQDFTVRAQQNRSSITTTAYLHWKPPRKPGVVRYRVIRAAVSRPFARILISWNNIVVARAGSLRCSYWFASLFRQPDLTFPSSHIDFIYWHSAQPAARSGRFGSICNAPTALHMTLRGLTN